VFHYCLLGGDNAVPGGIPVRFYYAFLV